MRRFLVLAAALLGLVASEASWSYVYCTTTVDEIHPNKNTGLVYFKFSDGTDIQIAATSAGYDQSFAIVLTAIATNRQVKIALNDGYACGVNNYENWTYIIAIP
jgi:hypothetical protein